MREDFLHYLWRFQQFTSLDLKTTNNEEVVIIFAGSLNHDAGPDFLNAKIKIGNQLWIGNVEIHLKSSDWQSHKHQYDEKYKSVILHVVYEDDKPILSEINNIKIPTLVLQNRFDKNLYKKYQNFLENNLWIPCLNQIINVDEIVKNTWIERLAIERLEYKSNTVIQLLNKLNGDWEELFYQSVSRSFGFNVNADSFEFLANSLPQKILAKHKTNLFQIEALLFGQAGMLNNDFIDEYPNALKKEFNYLKNLYGLKPIDNKPWLFLRLRPSNFPTIRIAQFANLIHKSSFLFSKLIEINKVNDIYKLFDCKCSEYWDTHFVFDKKSKISSKKIGKLSINNLIVNTVIPVVFSYSRIKNDEDLQEKLISFLKLIEAENNSIIKNWKMLGILADNAQRSQALIQLKTNYCDKKKCLNCAIGINLLKNE